MYVLIYIMSYICPTAAKNKIITGDGGHPKVPRKGATLPHWRATNTPTCIIIFIFIITFIIITIFIFIIVIIIIFIFIFIFIYMYICTILYNYSYMYVCIHVYVRPEWLYRETFMIGLHALLSH